MTCFVKYKKMHLFANELPQKSLAHPPTNDIESTCGPILQDKPVPKAIFYHHTTLLSILICPIPSRSFPQASSSNSFLAKPDYLILPLLLRLCQHSSRFPST